MVIKYTNAPKIKELISYPEAFSATTNPTKETIENMIDRAMEKIEIQTNNSWRIKQITNERRDISGIYSWSTGIKIYLDHRNILTLDSTALDSLTVWNGSTDEEWLGTKTEGRNNDYWLDYEMGLLFLRSGYTRRPLGLKITYRYNGGHETAIDDSNNINDSVTTVTVDSTAGFPISGFIRIEDEDILYTGKTATTFTGLVRGSYNTTAASHNDNVAIYTIPQDIEEACSKLVAIELAQGSDRSSVFPEGTDSLNLDQKVQRWKEDVKEILWRRTEIQFGVR